MLRSEETLRFKTWNYFCQSLRSRTLRHICPFGISNLVSSNQVPDYIKYSVKACYTIAQKNFQIKSNRRIWWRIFFYCSNCWVWIYATNEKKVITQRVEELVLNAKKIKKLQTYKSYLLVRRKHWLNRYIWYSCSGIPIAVILYTFPKCDG